MHDWCVFYASHPLPQTPFLNFYMDYFESNLFNNLFFPFYTYYVDDCLALLNSSNLILPNNLSNNHCYELHRQTQFSSEFENNNWLSFLDAMVFCENNSFLYTFFPSLTHRLSSNLLIEKLTVFNTYDLNICFPENLLNEKLFILY